MATPLTVSTAKFHDLLGHYSEKADVIPLGCPGLMEFVERGQLDTPQVRNYLRELLVPYLEHRSVDAIVLGCTHYPFVKPLIGQIAGPEVTIFDGGQGTARELMRRLAQGNLLTDRGTPGSVSFEESIPEKVQLCRSLLQTK